MAVEEVDRSFWAMSSFVVYKLGLGCVDLVEHVGGRVAPSRVGRPVVMAVEEVDRSFWAMSSFVVYKLGLGCVDC
jgi:hypothetical protein